VDLSFGYGALGSLPRIRDCRARRASSYGRTGGNADFVQMAPGEAKLFAELPGAGVVRHLWFDGGSNEEHGHRRSTPQSWKIWDVSTRNGGVRILRRPSRGRLVAPRSACLATAALVNGRLPTSGEQVFRAAVTPGRPGRRRPSSRQERWDATAWRLVG